MADGHPTGYLPGDPRYGLQDEALKTYYRTKPAQWAIYCWDKPGATQARRAFATRKGMRPQMRIAMNRESRTGRCLTASVSNV